MKIQPYDLTFIAEELGRRKPAPLRYLTVLLRHSSAVVREGVVYGLAYHVNVPSVRAALEAVADHDSNACIRVAAAEALEP